MTMGHRIRSTHTTGIVFHWPRLYDLLVWALTFGRERAYREGLPTLHVSFPANRSGPAGPGRASGHHGLNLQLTFPD
jgi:hypothetical protein